MDSGDKFRTTIRLECKKAKTLAKFCALTNLSRKKPLLQGCGLHPTPFNNQTNQFERETQVFAEINGPRKLHPLTGVGIKQVMFDNGTLIFRDMSPENKNPETKERIFLPQHHYLHLLHHYYPNATWLYTKRPSKPWASSVMRWHWSMFLGFYNEFWLRLVVTKKIEEKKVPGF